MISNAKVHVRTKIAVPHCAINPTLIQSCIAGFFNPPSSMRSDSSSQRVFPRAISTGRVSQLERQPRYLGGTARQQLQRGRLCKHLSQQYRSRTDQQDQAARTEIDDRHCPRDICIGLWIGYEAEARAECTEAVGTDERIGISGMLGRNNILVETCFPVNFLLLLEKRWLTFSS